MAEGAAALAVSMGIGRFVYTPILPLMREQAGLSPSFGATLATGNYAGYLLGALAGIFIPRLMRGGLVLRLNLVIMIATLVLMPVTRDPWAWWALRFVAGTTSALVFVIAVSAMISHVKGRAQHLVGWGFGGVGVGIALSGSVLLILRSTSTWRAAWWSAAALAVVLAALAWWLAPGPGDPSALQWDGDPPRTQRWFALLLTAYTLEGVGYIIAGTFLVAAISQSSPGWVGSGAWVLVGLAAMPASAIWAALGRRWTRPTLLAAALVVQAVGIAVPALVGGIAAALISAVLFGATFIGIGSLVLGLGAHLQFPRAIALLTTAYSVGQIAGPLIVTPQLHDGYHSALIVGSMIVLSAGFAAIALRVKFPQQVGVMVEPSRQLQSFRVRDGAVAKPDHGSE